MRKDHRENTVGPWAAAKLEALENYLEFYGVALSKQPFKRVYIDAFAGACHTKVRAGDVNNEPSPFFDEPDDSNNQVEFITGSPIRALNIKHPFHHYYFYDLDQTRAQILSNETKGRNDVTIEVEDCNASICKLAPKLKSRDMRGVAFLDPYGAHLKWTTLEALADTKTMEVVINFPLAMAINRLITRSRDDLPESWKAQLTDCFGTDEWLNLSYSGGTDLFGEEIVTKKGGVAELLLDLYISRLKKIFPYVASPRLIKNTKNRPLYYLIWAGPNKLGLKGADYILSQGEKVSARTAK